MLPQSQVDLRRGCGSVRIVGGEKTEPDVLGRRAALDQARKRADELADVSKLYFSIALRPVP